VLFASFLAADCEDTILLRLLIDMIHRSFRYQSQKLQFLRSLVGQTWSAIRYGRVKNADPFVSLVREVL
jgi:hypothetical protein